MSRQSPFNVGFAPQAMARPAATAGGAVFAGQTGGTNLPGVRRQSGPQAPIGASSSANLGNDVNRIGYFTGLIQQRNAAAGPFSAESRKTSAQRPLLDQAAASRAQFRVGSPQLTGANWANFVRQQAGAGRQAGPGQQAGVSGMELVQSPPGSRVGSQGQEAAFNPAGLTGAAGGLLGGQGGASQINMGAAAFGQPQQTLTRLQELAQARQQLAGASTAPPALGGAVQGLGTAAPFAARYRHNSSDGAAAGGQAYAAGYDRAGRRNSVGFGNQSGGMNPFASHSFAGHYGQEAAPSNFAGHYGGQAASNFAQQYADQYAGHYGGQGMSSNFAGQYGSVHDDGLGQYGRQPAVSNFAGQYGGQSAQVPYQRQRRASLGLGSGYF